MRFNLTLLIFILANLYWIMCFNPFCYSKCDRDYLFMKEATKAPTLLWYDYIIIGGGTAGIPLATTLSQTAKVLILERGGSPYGNKNITEQSGAMNVICDYSPTSPAQHFISEDGVPNVRARVLGGGTCINRGFYSRASHDYVIRAGWDLKLVNESFHWVEKLLVHEPGPLVQWQVAVRDGLLEAGVRPDNGFTYEHLIGTKIGGTIFDRGGHRHSAADLLAQANPKGITVLLHATVSRILFKHKGKPTPKACGVIFKDSRRITHIAYLNEGLNNEIILSAGALGSPQLLMLSGIGPKNHLQSLGIEVVMDQPLIGQAMSDNPRNLIYVPSSSPVEASGAQLVSITNHSRSYIFANSLTGIDTCPWETSRLQKISFGGGRFTAKVAKPMSTGYLKLKDRNPDNNPSVTFNYFVKSEDVLTCVEYLKVIKRLIQSEAYSKFRYLGESFDDILNFSAYFLGADQSGRLVNYSMALDRYCRDTVSTIWHYHGGCQVGQVVDHNYKVIGVDALRVLDGSTFNISPGTNPQATLLMLGRYMGVKIQKERLEMEESTLSIIHEDLR